ncbi:MAG: DUF420 domain-containing protein [Thermoanaerobaculia bacterium]|nr:DUF420 domain-containing protein [Thermoanaerobaculia bacterium]
MIASSLLPTLNACLNASSAVCLAIGYALIRNKRREGHRIAMLMAVFFSTAFLAFYLYYHYQVGSVRYPGTGGLRTLYLTILLTHTVLAAAVPFLAGATLYQALRGRFHRHRAIARWTLPIWGYVSVTGVIIYLMLYHLADAI